jgi:hypothetical protein
MVLVLRLGPRGGCTEPAVHQQYEDVGVASEAVLVQACLGVAPAAVPSAAGDSIQASRYWTIDEPCRSRQDTAADEVLDTQGKRDELSQSEGCCGEIQEQ